jgi:hypothetical protein
LQAISDEDAKSQIREAQQARPGHQCRPVGKQIRRPHPQQDRRQQKPIAD